jgi:hypothetical protein
MATLFTVTVDTEEEWDWSSGWPTKDFTVANIRSLPRFQEVCNRHAVAPTYFVNYAVLKDAHACSIVLDVARNPRVEIGMHIHPWNTPPLPAEPVRARESFLHNLPQEQILDKLNAVYNLFLEKGLKPTSFRGGRYSTNDTVSRFLKDRGFVADASALPYTSWADDGAPDHRKRDLYPVRRNDNGEGERSLWEIPLTLAFTRRPFALWARLFRAVEGSPLRHLRLIGIAGRLGLVRKVWLNFEDPMGRKMLPFLKKLRRMKLPCVCFTFHSSSLMAGGNGYTRTAAERERLFAGIDNILSILAGWDDFQPATVSEVAAHLEKNYHACSGA